MKYEVDPDFQACGEKAFQALGIPPDQPTPRFPRGDLVSRRAAAPFYRKLLDLDPEVIGVTRTQYSVPASDGYQLPIFAYQKDDHRNGTGLHPAVLSIHGGGMIFGSAEMFEPSTKADVAATGVAHFSVDYRVAPEARHPTPVEDCYAALKWLYSEAASLGFDKSRIAVAGLSAGGGLAAAVALLARDRRLDPPLAKQILLEPMLDDRNTKEDPELMPFVTWSWDDNWTGWDALLGDEAGSSSVSAYAAPARVQDLSGLPSTYIDVGMLDIFAKEDELYAVRLRNAGVDVEWHLYQGVPHGFELRGQGSAILRKALLNRQSALRSF
ncbi:Alpha/Beta hydrolase protein [Lophiotrema nucula]|uniref:Alpha/Beta hydrolase protein n=1 Tax=Lophiotrema nucula TaxID=690887 RepID=A0A6A5YGM7_9PLEO|nr:Alpha/Beta hydrolase protein [Lophiotrema nucula]